MRTQPRNGWHTPGASIAVVMAAIATLAIFAAPATAGSWALNASPDPIARSTWAADRLMSPAATTDLFALTPEVPNEHSYRVAFLGSSVGALFGQAAQAAAPTLTSPSPADGSVAADGPLGGTADVTFSVVYTDADGDAPTVTQLLVFSDPAGASPIAGSPFTLTAPGSDWVSGETFSTTLGLNTDATYYFRFSFANAADGAIELPVSPTLFSIYVAPTLSNPTFAPPSGLQSDTYTFGVTYTSAADLPPSGGNVWLLIEATNYTPTVLQALQMAVDTTAAANLHDGDFTNGERYVVTAKGISDIPGGNQILDGDHEHWFVINTVPTATPPLARLPVSESEVIDGPLVNDPPFPPTAGFSPESPDYPASQHGADITVVDDATPEFSWNPGTDPNRTDTADDLTYTLQLSQSPDFIPVVFQYATTTAGATTFTIPEGFPLSEGRWYWRVRTTDNDGVDSANWSTDGGTPYLATTVFRVDLNTAPYWDPASTIDEFTPTGDINTNLPLFDWPDGLDGNPTDTPATLVYRLQVDDDPNFGSPLINVKLAPGVTEYQTMPGSELLRNVLYYWRVRIADDQGYASDWNTAELALDPVPSTTFVGVPPTLTDPSLDPLSGPQAGSFAFGITYTDADNDPPPSGRIWTMIENTTAGTPLQALQMEVDPAAAPELRDGDYTNGERYTASAFGVSMIPGADQIGDGEHRHHFIADAIPGDPISPEARYPVPVDEFVDGPLVNDPPAISLGGYSPESPNFPLTQSGDDVTVVHTATPTFAWDPASDINAMDTPDTLYYVLQLSQDKDYDPVAYEYTTDPGETEFTIDAGFPLSAGVWYWRLRTFDDSDEPSTEWTYAGGVPFESTQVFRVDLNQPPYWPAALTRVGFLPDGDIPVLTPLIDWPEGEDDDPTDPASTLSYHLQVDDNLDFSTPLVDTMVGPGVTQYQLTAGQALIVGRTYYYRLMVLDDQGAMSGWHNDELSLDPPSNMQVVTNFVLQNPTLDPVFGGLGTDFAFSVEYLDTGNLAPPTEIMLHVGPLDIAMTRDPADTDAYDVGVTYLATVNGATLGYGAWDHYFDVADTPVRTPAAPSTLPGPIIGSVSAARFTNAAWANVTSYEEGDTIYAEVTDADENRNAGAADTVSVTISDSGGQETETLTLTETGNSTGIFRGQINSIGTAGLSNNGVYQLPAGPGGATLSLDYSDPDGGDTASDTAAYVDTIAPPALAAGELTVTGSPNGVTADLDWSAYNEGATIDIAGYHIWQRTSNFGNTALATQIGDVPVGTQTFQVTGLSLGVQYWFAVTPYDEVPNEISAVNTVSVTAADTALPYFANRLPAPDAVEVARSTNIGFDVLDDGSGVDQTRITAALDGVSISNDLVITPIAGGFSVSYDPPTDFDWNQQVTVTARAYDLAGNMVFDTWQFSTVTDVTAPQVVNKQFTTSPAQVSFDITDDLSGVDVSTLVFLVDGVDRTALSTINATDPLNVHVVYQPGAGWPFNTPVQFSVDVADIAGNAAATDTWTENGPNDGSAPILDQFVPADGASNAAVGTSIAFRVRDSLSGIDASSLVMTVNGQDVSADLVTNIIAAAGDASELTATYTPPAPLSFGATYDVHVEAADVVGNLATANWSFTTASAPTYEISGVVTDANDDPLPGVDVSAGGVIVGTDGNGVYRITGLVAGTYAVVPSLAEYDFAPSSRSVTLGPNARDINFVGTKRLYQISGRVVDAGGQGVAGVEVTDGTRTAATDALGNYVLLNVPNGLYTITCSRDGNSDGFEDFTYTPASRTVNVTGGNVVGVNFTATGQTYTITGTISDTRGNRISGVTVSDGVRSAITNEAGQFTIGGVPPGTATLTPTRAGMAFDPVSRQVTVPPSSTGNIFTAFTEFSHRFAPGLQMVAVPATPPSSQSRAVDVFGTAQVARWDPTAAPPTYISGVSDPDSVELTVRPGAGFFVNFPASTTVRLPGDAVNGTGTFSVGVTTGWNMLGNMYEAALPMANITAAGSTQIRPFAFIYDPALGGYRMISASPAFNAARNFIEVWEGAWFRAVGPSGTLNVAAPVGVSASSLVTGAAAQAEVPDGGWLLPIEARAAGRADVTTVAGVGSGPDAQGYRVENPPQVPGGVDVYFTGAGGELLAHDIRPASAGAMVWTFAVETDLPNTEVEVTLPDLSAVPADLAVYLTDEDTGERMYARTLPAYSFVSDADGALRHFSLEVAPRGADNLAIRSAAVQSGAGGLMVTYDVSAGCSVSVEVLNVAGRVVRTLVADRAVPAGQNGQLWDLRSAAGTAVPSGSYLIKIEAVAENGQRVQALRPAQITR